MSVTSILKTVYRTRDIFNKSTEVFYAASSLSSLKINQRYYARWSSRKPSKVFTPIEDQTKFIDPSEQIETKQEEEKSCPPKPVSDNQYQNGRSEFPTGKIHSIDGKDYVILKEDDTTFSDMMIKVGNRNQRRKNNLMMLEGKRLNYDALQAGLVPKKLFFTQKTYLNELQLPQNTKVPLLRLPYKIMKIWSRLETPPGVVGFYNIPRPDNTVKTAQEMVQLRVLCDNVRDPGNMGSIIRVAAGVGARELVLMKGCTDPWDSKVLRSASGGHFHIPIQADLSWHEHKDFLSPSDQIFVADSALNRILPPKLTLPQSVYYDVNYTAAESVVVIIGGETEGVSQDALELASEYNGSRVYIPLARQVESLNSGSALSVILFEIKRQILLNQKLAANQFQYSEKSRSCETI